MIRSCSFLLLVVIYPSFSLAMVPLTRLHLPLTIGVNGSAMLLTIEPAAIVLLTVWPREHPLPLLLIIDILALIPPSILKREQSSPMHHIVLPFTLVFATVSPCVAAVAVHFVADELALEHASILPGEPPAAVLFAVGVLAFVDGSVFPTFLTVAMVLVVSPLADIFCAIGMLVGPCTVHHVILELSNIRITIDMNESTLAVFLVIQPVSFIR